MGIVNGEAQARWQARSAKIGAGLAIMLVVCVVDIYLVWPHLAEAAYSARLFITGCITAPDEPAKLTGEAVFQRVPTGATPVDGPSVQQPCADGGGSESSLSGEVAVEYRSGLSHEEIRGHYEAVARDSGWRFEVSDRRLVFGMKTLRDRCLWLSVFPDDAGRHGYYIIEVSFWPKYDDYYCRRDQ
ncbi:hypothetical protein D7193_11810 [Micromonospora costi]|uniref:Uncharacterized protein n=1 Tax=Micromonospora costi TaxID=1530042 RepID=A0A3B0A670_9ACTN|nr:hypothetical protein D7193_11810 [Micromonospora costi]